ncbi:MAG: MarR family transcriptional regulator [Candidatus Bathyarchaeia archaeon]
MYDSLLMVTLLLLLATIVAAVYYHGRIKRAHEEYEKAKDVVEDIVISFNRQVQRQEDRLSLIAYKTEAVSSKLEKIEKKARGQARQLADVTSKVGVLSKVNQKIATQIKRMSKRFEDAIATQERIMKKIEEMEKAEYGVPAMPEAKVEAVIPIKREKALAPLTETELSVLNILATEGTKTAPEIRDSIKLTREHTARLMKKLYEAGYLERDTRKIPYAYRVKKEMLRILKKTEAKA